MICPACKKQIDIAVQRPSFCPWCGERLPAEDGDLEGKLNAVRAKDDPVEKHALLIKLREEYPDCLAVEREILYLGRMHERIGRPDFYRIPFWPLSALEKPKDFTRGMRREMLEPLADARKEFVELPQLLASAVFKFGEGRPLTLKTCGKAKKDVPANLRTEAVAKERDGGLFVRITAYEPDMAGTSASVRKFDDTGIWLDNGVELMIDPTGARREFMHFMVNSAGSWADFMHRKTKNGNWSGDVKWNSGAKVEVRRLEDRWICEIYIPSSVFNDGLPKKFPAEIYRCRKMKEGGSKDGECSIWGAFSSGPCDFDRFGTWEVAK